MPVPAEIRRNATLVTLSGAVFAVVAILATGVDGVLTTAEVRGVPAGDVPVWLLRVAALLVAAIALVAAFRCWVRPAGQVAWAGALVLSLSWPALVVATDITTALPTALACVATCGLAVRWLVEREQSSLVAMAVALAAAVALDPATGLVLTAVTAAVLGVWARRQVLPSLGALVAGGAAGLVAHRLLPTATAAAAGRQVTDAGAVGLLSLAPIVVLVAMGVGQQQWPHRRNAAAVGLAAGLALLARPLAASDLTVGSLLPGLALLAVSAGAGALTAWEGARRTASQAVTVMVVVALVVHVAWQLVAASAGAGTRADDEAHAPRVVHHGEHGR